MKRILFILLSSLIAISAVAQAPVLSIPDSEKIYCGGTYAPVLFAKIDAGSSGDNTIVAAVTGKTIRVLSWDLVASSAVTVRWESGASGTALTGQYNITDNGGLSVNCWPTGCFETASATLLNLELGGAVAVDGRITYAKCE